MAKSRLDEIDESKLSESEKEALKVMKDLKRHEEKLAFGIDIPLKISPDYKGGTIWGQAHEELNKGHEGSGWYEAFVRVTEDKKLVELGIAFVHYGPNILGEVAFPSDVILSMNKIDVIASYTRNRLSRRAHYKMDEENTARLKAYLIA